jgi:16S rRNA (cytosine967-C5)-methyltransferase
MGPCLPERRPARSAAGTDADSGQGAAVRATAATAVSAVCHHGRSLTDALAQAPLPADPRDGALLQELAFGTIRLLPRLRALTAILLKRPPKPADRVIEALLFVGLYQLMATRIPAHAAVSATVAAARRLQRPWASGLINASLRRFQRDGEALLARADQDPAARWLFPDWLLARLQQAWPEDWQAIVEASNGRGPMFLRVNPLRTDLAGYAARLAAAGIAARPVPGQPDALRLERPLATRALPGFDEGLVSVQDLNAQWAAPLLDPQPGERVLDACAAPGGKSAHLAEYARGALALTAVDADAERVETLRANLDRLGVVATVARGDAATPAADWPGRPYQRILLDVPCSATGVIRRHPDIKLLRRADDIPALVAVQAAMLDALWPLLAAGGRLLYATCSLLPEENEQQVLAFLGRCPDAREVPLTPAVGRPRAAGRQLLPGDGGGDGFYYALLERPPS